MTILTTILQAAQGGGSSMSFWIMMILVFVIMWFFMIRPQRKQQKEMEQMRKSLKKGDKVVSAGGIYGVIADLDETTVLVKVDGEVKIRFDKNSVSKLGEPVKKNEETAKKSEDQKSEEKKSEK